MLLWHIDYFELKTIEKKQIQEKIFAFPDLPKISITFCKGEPFLY